MLYSCYSFHYFFFSSRRRHTRWPRDWSSDVCSSDLQFRKVISAVSSSQWANLRLRIQRIADFEVGHVLDERRGEFVVNVSVNNDAFACDTRLTIIISARQHCSRCGRLEIRSRHDNKWIRAM